MKRGHETQIAQVCNGLVVKIGCQTLVVEPDELALLADYYKGEVPKGFKKMFSGMVTHMDEAQTGQVELCCDESIGRTSLPDFMRHRSCTKVYPVKNGWVIAKSEGCYIAKTKEQLMKIMTEYQQVNDEPSAVEEPPPYSEDCAPRCNNFGAECEESS